MNYGKEFTKGLIRENPTLVSLLGMCPTLAVTTGAFNGIGMGLSTAFVLIFSNLVISLLRKVIPEQVKLPCYIVIIATFVTLIQFLLHGFVPALYTNLGAFLELITVNCIILGRAEMFASKNTPLPSILDGAGMGLGFTLALFLMGSIREIFGSGSWFGLSIPFMQGHTMSLFVMPAGGFFVLGIIIAVVCRLSKKKPPKKIGCSACPNAAACEKDCIRIQDGLAVICTEECISCGKCAKACPNGLITLRSEKKKVDVLCSSKDMGKTAMQACQHACIGCKKCEKICKFDAIHVIDNHAVIDYDKCRSCGLCVKECPKQCIVKQVGKRPAVVKPKTDAEPAKPAAQN